VQDPALGLVEPHMTDLTHQSRLSRSLSSSISNIVNTSLGRKKSLYSPLPEL